MTTRLGWKTVVFGLMTLMLTAVPMAAQTAKDVPLTDEQVVALISGAKTPAEHQQLVAYYKQTATDLEKQAAQHKRLAAAYRRTPAPPRAAANTRTVAAEHCDRMSADLTKAAQEAKTMADHHGMLAKEAASR